jgi:hypothetical protein
MTPTKAPNGKWTDNNLTSECVIGPWLVNNSAVAAKYSSALTAIPTSATSTATKKSEAGGRHFGLGSGVGLGGMLELGGRAVDVGSVTVVVGVVVAVML